MSVGNFYRSDVGRGIGVVCGLVLLVPAFIFTAGCIAFAVLAPHQISTFLISALLGLIGCWFLRIAVRLLRGRGRADGGLLAPTEITIGAVILASCGVGLLVFGVIERDIGWVAAGVGSLPGSFYAWNLARVRRGRNAQPIAPADAAARRG